MLRKKHACFLLPLAAFRELALEAAAAVVAKAAAEAAQLAA